MQLLELVMYCLKNWIKLSRNYGVAKAFQPVYPVWDFARYYAGDS